LREAGITITPRINLRDNAFARDMASNTFSSESAFEAMPTKFGFSTPNSL